MAEYDPYIEKYAKLTVPLGVLNLGDWHMAQNLVDDYHFNLAMQTATVMGLPATSDAALIVANIGRYAASHTATSPLRFRYALQNDALDIEQLKHEGFDITETHNISTVGLAELLVRTATVAAILAKATSIPEYKVPITERPLINDIAEDTRQGGTIVSRKRPKETLGSDQLLEMLDKYHIRYREIPDFLTMFDTASIGDQVDLVMEVFATYIDNMANEATRRVEEANEGTKTIALIEKQLETANTAIEKLGNELASRDARIEELETALADTTRERNMLERQVHDLTADLDSVTAVSDASSSEPKTIVKHEHIDLDPSLFVPTSYATLIEAAESFWSDDIVFSKKAADDLDDMPSSVQTIWDALCFIVETWLPTARTGRKLPENGATAESRFLIAYHETSDTRTSKKYRAMRTASYKGESVYTETHLKAPNLRLYFEYLPEHDTVLVVRCVRHLETIGSSRKGY